MFGFMIRALQTSEAFTQLHVSLSHERSLFLKLDASCILIVENLIPKILPDRNLILKLASKSIGLRYLDQSSLRGAFVGPATMLLFLSPNTFKKVNVLQRRTSFSQFFPMQKDQLIYRYEFYYSHAEDSRRNCRSSTGTNVKAMTKQQRYGGMELTLLLYTYTLSVPNYRLFNFLTSSLTTRPI